MAGLTTLLYILPLTFADSFLSHRTPDTFLQLIHPAWILLLTSSSHLPSLLTVDPRYLKFLVKKAKNFKYLGSTVSNDGRCEEEVRRRIQAGWMSWRKVSGVLCDRKLSAKVKGKIYKSVVRPAMLYGMETVAVTERQMGKMEIAELKMVRWALGVTRKDKIRNEYVRGTAKIAKLGEKLRNVRLRWYGHVKRREEDYVGKRMMEMAVPGRRKRGRPRRRWMDLVREDMERVGAREGDEVDRVKWRLLSRCGDPE